MFAERGEEGGRREAGGEGDGVSEVDLVGVSGGDVGFDLLDGGEVVGRGDAEGGVGEDGGGVGFGMGSEVGYREGVGVEGSCFPTRPQVRVRMGHPRDEVAGGVVEDDGCGVGSEES